MMKERMEMKRRTFISSGVAAAGFASARARAQEKAVVRIGVLTDLSGPYRLVGGPGSVACAQQAIDEFTAANPDIKVELLSADHQNKPDIGSAIARQWVDERGVDLITDINNSAIAIALSSIAQQHDKVEMVTSAGTSEITGKYCNTNTLHWSWDSWAVAHSTATAVAKAGGDKWFFITPNYAFGRAMQDDTTKFVEAVGAKVVGSVSYPFPQTADFSSYLLTAHSSGANVIAFTSAGTDLGNCMKQAHEFGLTNGQIKLVAMVGLITDMQSMGLPIAAGLTLTETFYWDLNDRTRGLYSRMKPKLPSDVFPNMSQIGNYSGVLNYLEAVKQLGVAGAKASGRATIEAMRAGRVDDDAFGISYIRIDGRVIHPTYLFQVKSPAESSGPGDVYKLLATTPTEEAFRPLNEGGCPLVRL
jgi:branched-chain amino acid transport system substrate-binding protein